MLDRFFMQGARDACAKFGIRTAAVVPPAAAGIFDKLKGFGAGQTGAVKDLFSNLRGGFGGKSNLGTTGHMAEGASGPIMDPGQLHRQRALSNLKTLTPSLVAGGGGMYLMHRHHQNNQLLQQQQQQAMTQDGGDGGGYPMM